MTSIELDLHGRSWKEASAEFIGIYNEAIQSEQAVSSLEIVVIHGYGSSGEGGVIRHRLRAFLQRYGDRLEFSHGEETMANPGCTIVRPRKPLPDNQAILEEQILDFCSQRRSRSAIIRKFHRYGDPQVRRAVTSFAASKASAQI